MTGGLLAAPRGAWAQPARKAHRIGFLGNSTAAFEANLVGPFREGLRELGYVEGRNLVIEYRWAEGHYDRFPALIAELIALNVAAGRRPDPVTRSTRGRTRAGAVGAALREAPGPRRSERGRRPRNPASRGEVRKGGAAPSELR